jgi:hypothetical protein
MFASGIVVDSEADTGKLKITDAVRTGKQSKRRLSNSLLNTFVDVALRSTTT